MFRLDGKVIILTGAARGLGKATMPVLVKQEAKVAAVDILDDELREHAAPLGEVVKVYKADLGKVAQIQTLVDAVKKDFGRIDVLINNAAICQRIAFEKVTEADWDREMNINAKSPYFLMQAVVPAMREQKGGRIINVVSSAGQIGAIRTASIYSASKGAILAVSKSIAREVAADGITVNCMAPGGMLTDKYKECPPDTMEDIMRMLPMKRMTTPEEMAPVLAFMSSDECSYATGATMDFMGGFVMR